MDGDAPQNKGILPFDGSEKSGLSPDASFAVHQQIPVSDPKQFWIIAPGIIAYPEAMIGDDVYDSPYYCWAYHAELLSFAGETDDFRGINTTALYPHPKSGYQFDLNYSYPIFRLEGEASTDLFTLEGQTITNDELTATCNRYGLKGLVFEEFWAW